MVKTGDTGEMLVAGDGVWFHPDDPAEDPELIIGKDGNPLALEKQLYTGDLTAEKAEAVFADPTAEEQQQTEEYMSELSDDEPDYIAESCGFRDPADELVIRGLALMHVRGKLHEPQCDEIRMLLALTKEGFERQFTDEGKFTTYSGMVDTLCDGMDLPSHDPLCRLLALTYELNILIDVQWELIAHLLRKVKGATATRAGG